MLHGKSFKISSYQQLTSLWYDRFRGDMIQIIKITNGIDDRGIVNNFLNLLIIMVLEIQITN